MFILEECASLSQIVIILLRNSFWLFLQILLLCVVTYVVADVKHLTDRNLDLFKYDPSDIYTLPEDIDDDKPAILFHGDVMKAKVDKLQSFSGNKKFKLE